MPAFLPRPHAPRRVVRISAIAVAGAFLATGLMARMVDAQAASAAPSGCSVVNAGRHASYATLRAAVDAASPGDNLQVKGTCVGTTVIAKPLTLQGRPGLAGNAALDGGGRGRVLEVRADVTLVDLSIVGGDVSKARFPDDVGGGILNAGSLVLRGVTVRGNSAWEGGGIDNRGSLELIRSSVTSNHADAGAAGGTLGRGGGGVFSEAGRAVTLVDSTVDSNTSRGSDGGGVYLDVRASLILMGQSAIRGNFAGRGGGIYETYATTTCLPNGSISLNRGGGIAGYGELLTGCVAGLNVIGNVPIDIR